jgi:hypothetical protein
MPAFRHACQDLDGLDEGSQSEDLTAQVGVDPHEFDGPILVESGETVDGRGGGT